MCLWFYSECISTPDKVKYQPDHSLLGADIITLSLTAVIDHHLLYDSH